MSGGYKRARVYAVVQRSMTGDVVLGVHVDPEIAERARARQQAIVDRLGGRTMPLEVVPMIEADQ